jgi:outer membrane protein assembly factor BamA
MDRNYILELYQSSGYPDVDFEYKATPGPGPQQVTVAYIVKEGDPRFVRGVLISGLHTSRDRLIRPAILMKPGDPLSWIDMAVMQRRLYNLGVFDKVDMAIQNPDGDTQNKYVLYNLTEGRRYFMAVGFGAEVARIGGSTSQSLDNPGGQTGFSPRASFQISRINLWGIGHSINLKTRYSTLDRQASITYLAPRFRNVEGRNITVSALYDNTRDVLTYTAQRIEGSIQMSQRHSRATTFLVRYTWRDVKVDTNSLKISPELIPQQSQAARIALIGGSVIRDRRDDPTNAHHGMYSSADLDLVNRIFGGNKNFLRFLGRTSLYKQIKPDWVLATNTQLGWIKPFSTGGVDGFDDVPLPERFYGGGGNSDRGFAYNQAGPRDLKTGFPVGGNAMFFHSTELRFPFLLDNLNGVIFHDMGNIFANMSDFSFRVHQNGIEDFNYMVHAVGAGIRYRTPIGPVRVDLAYSLNPPTFFGLKGTIQDLLKGTAVSTTQTLARINFFISIGQAF